MRTNYSNDFYNDLEKAIQTFFTQIKTGYGRGNAITGIAESLAEVLEPDDLDWLIIALKKEQEKNKA